MPEFLVRPIARGITTTVRATLRSPQYGHPVHRELARGTGPCRECLSPFAVQYDERLLFTYNPFGDSGAIPQPGPVFIHADACEPFAGEGYPGGLRSLPILAEAHFSDGTRSAPRKVVPDMASATLSELLDDSRVEFLHLRHADAGCFIARVERVPAILDGLS